MTQKLVHSMKLNPNKSSTRPPIFEHYEHPWYKFNKDQDQQAELLKKPNPPTVEAVEKAKFVDKTYHWNNKKR